MERESPEYLLAMFKHAIAGNDGLRENVNDWRVVMGKMELHCIGEVI